jgi:hypothetical protein
MLLLLSTGLSGEARSAHHRFDEMQGFEFCASPPWNVELSRCFSSEVGCPKPAMNIKERLPIPQGENGRNDSPGLPQAVLGVGVGLPRRVFYQVFVLLSLQSVVASVSESDPSILNIK